MQIGGAQHVAEKRPALEVSSSTDGLEWDAFVEKHPRGTVDHLWGWRSIFKDVFGHDSEYLFARRGGAVAGVLPLVIFKSRLFGRQVVSLPMLNYGGLLLQDDSAAEPLIERAMEIARDVGASHIEFRHQTRITTLPGRQHKVSMRMALPSSVDEMWQRLDRKVRNQVRKAQKSELTVSAGKGDHVESFYRVFAENMRDLGTPVYSKGLFERVVDVFATRARLHVVWLGEKPIAGGVALRLNDTVLVPWASSLKTYRQLCPNMLLYWSMIETAIGDGVRVFDFGRSTPDGGTYQFKLQWGAVAEPQSWEYVLLGGRTLPDHRPSSSKFDLAIQTWKRLPLWLANLAGPRIVRNIP